MTKSFKMFKVTLYNIFNINKFKAKSLPKKVGIILLILYIISSMMLFMGIFSYNLANTLSKANMMPLFLSIFFNLASMLVIFTGIRSSKNSLFDSKDKEQLLSLPIKIKEIILAKLLDMYLVNIVITFFILIPPLVVYSIKVNTSIIFYIFYIIATFIIPIIPTIIASLVGYIMARIIPKSNKKNIFEIIFSFILIGVIMYLNTNMQGILVSITNNNKAVETMMKYISYPTYLLTDGLFNLNILSLITYVFINLVLIYIFINFMNINYTKILSKFSESTVSKKKPQKKLISSSIIKTLMKKEANKFISSPIYLTNSIFGVVILLVTSIASLFISKEPIINQIGISNIDLNYIVLTVVLFTVGMSNISAVSISMERKKFYILKSLPIREKTIINSKVLFSMFVVIPLTLISIILFKFSLNLKIIDTLILILLLPVYSMVISKFGLILNLKFPKMDAINDQVIVKQSISSVISLLVPMFSYMLILTIFSNKLIKINFLVLCSLCILMFFAFNIILELIINKWGIKRLKIID